jgi:hypothetical protein
MSTTKASRGLTLLLFFGVFLSYVALSPGTLSGMGYNREEMQAGNSVLGVIHGYVSGRSAPPVRWSRNGPVPLLLNMPLLQIGRWTGSEDYAMSFAPALETTLLVTLLFAWLRRLTSPGMSFFLAVTAAFGTMLWPYAYIGLETKQALFLLVSAFLALTDRPPDSYPKALGFGLSCALALGAKESGFMLVPAVAYLGYVRPLLPLAALGVIALIQVPVTILRHLYWASGSVTMFQQFRGTLVVSVFQFLGNALGMFGSPTKGLFLYAPLLIFFLWAVPRAGHSHRDLAVFVLLTVGGLVGGFALSIYYVDETWGPRYLESCVAPMVLLIGASRGRFSLRRDGAMIPLAALGLVVSFLGAFFYYGNMPSVAQHVRQNNLAELTADQRWNHIAFNARLFMIWCTSPPTPALWAPTQHWMWSAPEDVAQPQPVDLRDWARPQALLVRTWGISSPRGPVCRWLAALLCAIVGPALLVWAGARSLRAETALGPETPESPQGTERVSGAGGTTSPTGHPPLRSAHSSHDLDDDLR